MRGLLISGGALFCAGGDCGFYVYKEEEAGENFCKNEKNGGKRAGWRFETEKLRYKIYRKEVKIMKKLEEYVRSIPDFPEPGIIFRDITTILTGCRRTAACDRRNPEILRGGDYDIVVGPESRGFIFGVPVAYAMHKGFVPIRKKGKLPCKTVSVSYDLEYGSAVLEMHEDAIKPGQKVVIVDDLIATGGTTEAIVKLIEKMGGEVVKICCVMELAGLKGREKLNGYAVDALITYEGK